MKKTIEDLNLKNKKVLIRVDFNVPIKNGIITSNKRIKAAIPTINYAVESGAKVILLSHLGRVKNLEDKSKKSLKIVSEELSKLMRKNITFVPETRGKNLENKIDEMNPGDILMIENTRFEDLNNSAESKNSPELGKYWASLGDIFINDAFGTVHRTHASNVGISKNIKESAVGFLVQEELSMLAKAVYGNKKPFVAIIGGAKITDKIKVVNNLIDKVDYLLIGGGMAFTFWAAQGLSIGSSLVEKDQIPVAREYMKKYSHKIILPVDAALSEDFSNSKPLFNAYNPLEIPLSIPKGYMGLDIGPKTIELFGKILMGAKTVIWNGPMGVAEFDNYKIGTEAIANIIASQPDVFSIIGGGDSAAAIINLGLEKNFTHISTGGGASLQFLEGVALPGVEAIQENKGSAKRGTTSEIAPKNNNEIVHPKQDLKPTKPEENKNSTNSTKTILVEASNTQNFEVEKKEKKTLNDSSDAKDTKLDESAKPEGNKNSTNSTKTILVEASNTQNFEVEKKEKKTLNDSSDAKDTKLDESAKPIKSEEKKNLVTSTQTIPITPEFEFEKEETSPKSKSWFSWFKRDKKTHELPKQEHELPNQEVKEVVESKEPIATNTSETKINDLPKKPVNQPVNNDSLKSTTSETKINDLPKKQNPEIKLNETQSIKVSPTKPQTENIVKKDEDVKDSTNSIKVSPTNPSTPVVQQNSTQSVRLSTDIASLEKSKLIKEEAELKKSEILKKQQINKVATFNDKTGKISISRDVVPAKNDLMNNNTTKK